MVSFLPFGSSSGVTMASYTVEMPIKSKIKRSKYLCSATIPITTLILDPSGKMKTDLP